MKRLCKNSTCNERFLPKSINHYYHDEACRKATKVTRQDVEILADELGVDTLDHTLLLSQAFSQKNEALREVEKLKSLRQYLKYEIQNIPTKKIKRNLPTVHAGSKVLLLQVGDWQVGKLENGIGVVETANRIAKLAASSRSIAKVHDVDYIVVQFLGDMIEGCYIYRGQNVTGLDRQGNTHRITVQIKTTAQEQAWFVEQLSDPWDVLAMSVPGNHGRPNGINDYADQEDNFDTLAAWWAEDITKHNDKAFWDIQENWKHEYNILGKNILAMHGDQWTGPLDKINTLLPQWIATGYIKQPDIVLLGHRHQFEVRTIGSITVVQNGTIDGGSTWYTKAYGRASKPQQTSLIISQSHGLEAIYPIYF